MNGAVDLHLGQAELTFTAAGDALVRRSVLPSGVRALSEFKGTAERTALDIAISFDAVGGEHNALTAKEYTCYYARRAAGQLGGASALALEDSDTRMSRLGRAELTLGEFADLDEALRRIALVTVDDVQALAQDLVSRPFSLVAVGAIDEAAVQGAVDPTAPTGDVA